MQWRVFLYQPNGLVDPKNYENLAEELVLALDLAQRAMDALVQVWQSIATRDEKGVSVNFLFSKTMDDLEIHSDLPVRGRVESDLKQPADLYVRIPKYAILENFRLTVDGRELSKRRVGNYLWVPKPSGRSTAVIEFKRQIRQETETIAGTTYQVEWLGDTVWNIIPAGKYAPLYYPTRLVMYGYSYDP